MAPPFFCMAPTAPLPFHQTISAFERQISQDELLYKWYAPTSQLDALLEWCAQSAPQKVPPLKCEPYEGLFVTDRGDKGLTRDISRSVICEATVPRMCMRTHVGQHLLQREGVEGQEEICLATACGFCGDRVTCSTQVVMRNKRTHALVTLMISDCPSQPAKLRWDTLAKEICKQPVHESSCTVSPMHKDSLVILPSTSLCKWA